MQKDKRIDDYIKKSANFAKPILVHLRELIHLACPEVKETMKWGMPFFDYLGPICNLAAFKQHAVFGFWKYTLLNDPKGYLTQRANSGGEAMGNLGRITDLKNLPPDEVLIDFIKQAKKLNEEGIKVPKKSTEKPELNIPDYFMNTLKENKKALTNFNGFSHSHKKEYIDWISSAKREETRLKRIETAISWLTEGKGKNWKYEKC